MSGAAPGTLSASIGGTRLLAGRLHAARQNGMGFFGAPPAGQEVMFQDLTKTLAALSCRALQRQDGRSVGVRAPGMFMAMLRRKAASAGGKVVEFPAHRANPFQVCHGCGTIHKKPLSLRVHACACGVEMQRDLYSSWRGA